MEGKSLHPGTLVEALEGDAWFSTLIRSLAERTGGDPDELAQRTRIAAWRQFGSRLVPRAWMARVARHAAWGDVRARGRRRDHEQRAAELSPPPGSAGATRSSADAVEALEVRRAVLDAVQALPDPLRVAVVMRHFDELSIREIAERTAAPVETVRSRLARARALLRQDLGKGSNERPWLQLAFAACLPPTATRLPLATAALMTTKTTSTGPLIALAVLAALLVGARLATGGAPDPEPQEVGGAAAPLTADPDPENEPHDVAVAPVRSAIDPAVGAQEPALERRRIAARGLVVDAQGRPLQGATVFAVDPGEAAGPEVSTDADGRFSWSHGGGGHRLRASLDGQTPLLDAYVVEGADEELLLALGPRCSLGGRVVDAEGDPIAKAVVTFRLSESWAAPLGRSLAGGDARWEEVSTDESGRFRFDDVPAVEGSSLWVKAPDRHSRRFDAPHVDTDDILLRFDRPARPDVERVAVTVTHDGASPVQDAHVYIRGATYVTGDDGTLRIPRSRLGEADRFYVTLRGSSPWRVDAPRSSGPVTAVEATGGFRWDGPGASWPDAVVVTLPDQPAPRLMGVVVDTEGEPVEGASVWFHDAKRGGGRPFGLEATLGNLRTGTDNEGRFALCGLPDRIYSIEVRDGDSLRSVVVEGLRPGSGGVRVVLDCAPRLCQVRGRCVAADGTPVPGVIVEPRYDMGPYGRNGDPNESTATSDERGRFVLAAVPSDFSSLQCRGRTVMPGEIRVARDEPRSTGSDLVRDVEITVPRRGHVRFDASSIDLPYTTASLLGPNGKSTVLWVFSWMPSLEIEGAQGTHEAKFAGGLSPVYAVGEGEYRAVLEGPDGGIVAEVEVAVGAGLEHTEITFSRDR